MEHATVTLLQAATLGRQSLAAGVQVRVPHAQAQAWAAAGIAAMDAEQKPPASLVNADDEAIQTIAKSTQKRVKKG